MVKDPDHEVSYPRKTCYYVMVAKLQCLTYKIGFIMISTSQSDCKIKQDHTLKVLKNILPTNT